MYVVTKQSSFNDVYRSPLDGCVCMEGVVQNWSFLLTRWLFFYFSEEYLFTEIYTLCKFGGFSDVYLLQSNLC